MIARIALFLSYLVLLYSPTSWSQMVSGDRPYLSLDYGIYNYIYTEEQAAEISHIIPWNEWFKEKYQKSFDWVFDETPHLIIASDHNQIANGYATPIPQLKTVFFPSGFLLQDEFAASSWFKILLIHESAHLYQTNVKSDISLLVKRIFGNTMVIPTPIVIPIFTHPNVFLPTVLLEGNAVMNESRWGEGGRLYSGEVRALVYAQALAPDTQLNATRLFNSHLDFPYGAESYYQGGYFFQYLAEKYGVDPVNQFFKRQARHFINPLILNETFWSVFGASYNQLFHEYSHALKEKAKGQRHLKKKPFARSLFFASLNNSERTLQFLTQPSGKGYPLLWVIPRSHPKPRSQKIDLAFGKVYPTDRGWATAVAAQRKPNKVEYGLYLKGLIPHPDYQGKMILDQNGKNILYADPVKSFFRGQLYLNDRFVSHADSSGILDNDGHVYYFLQEKDTRVLYKDGQPLFSYQGYYGKPMEVDSEGRVYFIASTERGSSLFRWNSGRLEECLDSDRVVEAYLIRDEVLLVAEVTSKGYEYKFSKLSPRPKTPYYFNNSLAQEIDIPISFVEQNYGEPKDYGSLSNIQYTHLDAIYTSTEEDGLMGAFSLNFNDPLEWNFLNLSYQRSTFWRDTAVFSYLNRRHQLNWFLSYVYDMNVDTDSEDRILEHYYDNGALFGLQYPLFIRGRWSMDWMGQVLWENTDQAFGEATNSYSGSNKLSLDWSVRQPLSYLEFRSFHVSAEHRTEMEESPFRKQDDIYSIRTSATYELPFENIFSLSYAASFSKDRNVKLDYFLLPNPLTDDYYSRSVDREYELNRLQVWEMSYYKVLNHSFYFSRFPVSLRRWTPFLKARFYDITEDSYDLKVPFWEYEYGAEAEVLLIHKFPFRVGFSGYYVDPPQPDRWGWTFHLAF